MVQVCEKMQDPKTRQREITALSEAMTELNQSSGFIVTRTEEEQINLDCGQIKIIPIWRFLLSII